MEKQIEPRFDVPPANQELYQHAISIKYCEIVALPSKALRAKAQNFLPVRKKVALKGKVYQIWSGHVL